MISLLCPTKGRPEKFKRMCQSAHATAGTDIEILATGSEEDEQDYGMRNCLICCSFITSSDFPTVMKWNYLASLADKESNLLMLAADDIVFESDGWGEALENHYKSLDRSKRIHVYHLRDSRDDSGTPHPIVTREYMDSIGFFLCPIFLHWFVDTWTVEIAKACGCFTHMKDFLLTHDKSSDRGEPDETHLGIRRMGWHERDEFVNALCQDYKNLLIEKLKEKIK